MDIQTFIQNFREAFGEKAELPLVFWYSDTQEGTAEKINGCFFKGLVLGGSHSIGGPLAVAADYSFIVPSGTMIIHPVRSNGMFIGVQQSLQNMIRTQKRITGFLAAHSHMNEERIEELMLNPTELVKDVGTLLEGEDAVREGLIDEVGGMSHALRKLHQMIDEK